MENYGYATELEYVNDFIPALNPLWIDFCLLLAGFDTPTHPDSTSFDYLELGFGKGNSLTLNASCSEGSFVGNDFIPPIANMRNISSMPPKQMQKSIKIILNN